jgi:hypothetical protein
VLLFDDSSPTIYIAHLLAIILGRSTFGLCAPLQTSIISRGLFLGEWA